MSKTDRLPKRLSVAFLIATMTLVAISASGQERSNHRLDTLARYGVVYAGLDGGPEQPLLERTTAVPSGTHITLRFTARAPAVTVENARWLGHGDIVTMAGDGSASVAIDGPGRHEVELRVRLRTSAGERCAASRRIVLMALDVVTRDVRASIVYPAPGGVSPVDLTGDDRIDRADQQAFVRAYATSAGQARYDSRADWDGDGIVGPSDRRAFRAAFAGWQGTDLTSRYDGGTVLPVAADAAAGSTLAPTPLVLARAVSKPPGLERWLVWSVDGEIRAAGSVLATSIAKPGEHRLGVALPKATGSDQRNIVTYRAAVYDPTRQRLFEPAHDRLREGVDYALEARTEPPGYGSHVRWRTATRYGSATYANTEGATFDVRFAHTFGVEDRAQRVVLQADNFIIDQNVLAAGQFPASLAHDLFDAIGALAAAVDAGAGAGDGGRTVLTHIRDQFLPVYYRVLDIELGMNSLQAFTPFRDNSESEVNTVIGQLLATRTDAELNQIVYIDSEMRLLPADFAFDAGLPARIDAETDAAGFLVSSSWVLKWLWNRSQAVLGCLAQGPAKIIVKLIGALHGAIHDGAISASATASPTVSTKLEKALTPAQQLEANATLDELVALSKIIVAGENATGGGRTVILQVRAQTLPYVDGVLRSALATSGQGNLTPFLDRGTADANTELDALLRLPDPQLDTLVYADISIVPAASSILAAETGIRQLIGGPPQIGLDTVEQARAGTAKLVLAGGFDPVKWLWDTAVGLIGCIPNIGALLEKLVGLAHDVAHGDPTSVPTAAELTASTAFDDLMVQILALNGDPQRGRSLALHLRDKTLPAVLDVIAAEVVDMGEPQLVGSATLGVTAQQDRMTALLERDDASLNAGLYDAKKAVRAYAETYATVFGVGVFPVGLHKRAAAGNVWNDLIRFIKCLSEGDSTSVAAGAAPSAGIDATVAAVPARASESGKSDKLIWVIEQVHSFLH